jgi:hypothetical protein
MSADQDNLAQRIALLEARATTDQATLAKTQADVEAFADQRERLGKLETKLESAEKQRESAKDELKELMRIRWMYQGFFAAVVLFGIISGGTLIYLFARVQDIGGSIDRYKQDLKKAADDQLADFSIRIVDARNGTRATIFETKNQCHLFVNHNPGSQAVDPRIEEGNPSGIVEDCSHLGIPSTAKGAIVHVGISKGSATSSLFIVSDAHGDFPDRNVGSCLANYNQGFVGGVVFCPFL